MPDRGGDRQQERAVPQPFWSGVLAFGLVSLPVSLFPVNRGQKLPLKMVDADGTPLSRRYFCEKEQKALSADEIVRGYPVDKDQYVAVEDKELEKVSKAELAAIRKAMRTLAGKELDRSELTDTRAKKLRGLIERKLEARSKDDLYARAQELDVPGRSRMSKRQLANAIRKRR